jgi:hypothetical protein
MYMNIYSVDKLMGSVVETYRFQIKSNLKANRSLSIHETAAYEMLLNWKSRPNTADSILQQAAGEMLENRASSLVI